MSAGRPYIESLDIICSNHQIQNALVRFAWQHARLHVYWLVQSLLLLQHVPCWLQAEDAATDMGGQATKAVAAAEAVMQEATAAVAKQLQRAIPEAQNLFSEEDAGPAANPADRAVSQDESSAQPSDSDDSDAEVSLPLKVGSQWLIFGCLCLGHDVIMLNLLCFQPTLGTVAATAAAAAADAQVHVWVALSDYQADLNQQVLLRLTVKQHCPGDAQPSRSTLCLLVKTHIRHISAQLFQNLNSSTQRVDHLYVIHIVIPAKTLTGGQ